VSATSIAADVGDIELDLMEIVLRRNAAVANRSEWRTSVKKAAP